MTIKLESDLCNMHTDKKGESQPPSPFFLSYTLNLLEVQRRLSLDAVREIPHIALFYTVADTKGTRSTLPTHTKLQGREPIVGKRAFVSV